MNDTHNISYIKDVGNSKSHNPLVHYINSTGGRQYKRVTRDGYLLATACAASTLAANRSNSGSGIPCARSPSRVRNK
jgi:hypothetical protein